MTYDLDALRAAVAASSGPLKQGRTSHDNARQSDGEHVATFRWAHDAHVNELLWNAARAGLLDDAALGRAVRAAAERDGPERAEEDGRNRFLTIAALISASGGQIDVYPDDLIDAHRQEVVRTDIPSTGVVRFQVRPARAALTHEATDGQS